MPYHQSLTSAVGLLFAALVTAGCSTSASDLISPTGDFWDRRPCVASERQAAPREAPSCEAPPRAFVQRQAPPTRRAEPAPFPAPQARRAARAPAPQRRAPTVATPQPQQRRVHAPASVEEMRVLEQVNRVRAQHQLRALRFHPTLWIAARDHSLEQDRHRYMGHGSPDPRRRELSQRMALAGYRGRVFAEVVAWGYPDVASVVEGWMNSTEHRRILLDPELTEAAFSRVGRYWTGNFGAPSPYGAVSAPRAAASAPPPSTTTFRRAPAPQPRRKAAPRTARTPAPAPAPRPTRRPAPAPQPSVAFPQQQGFG